MMRTVLSLLFVLTSAQVSFAAGSGGSSHHILHLVLVLTLPERAHIQIPAVEINKKTPSQKLTSLSTMKTLMTLLKNSKR